MTEDSTVEAGQKIEGPAPADDRSPAARRGRTVTTGALASGALALGAAALGALAVGAIAVGAIAIGRLAVGELSLGRAKLRRARVSELRIAKLTVGELRVERMPAPEGGSEQAEAAGNAALPLPGDRPAAAGLSSVASAERGG